jgi:hypothetical protein
MNEFDLSLITADIDPLQALRRATALRRRLEREEAALVRRARVGGASWAMVAEVLGVTKQAVHKKYAERQPRRGTGTGTASARVRPGPDQLTETAAHRPYPDPGGSPVNRRTTR